MTRLLALAALAALSPRASAQISTDRPGLAFTAANVDRGVLQIEAGTPDATINGGADVYAFPVALRFGLTPGIEARVLTSVLNVVDAGGALDVQEGFDAFTAGVRVALPTSSLNASVIAETVVPAEGDVSFQVNVPVSLSAGDYGLTFVPGLATGNGNSTLNAVGLVSRSFGDLTGYAELGVFPSIDDDGETPVLVGAGATLLLSRDLQVDTFFDAGLTDAAPDLLIGLGVSYRFGGR